MKISNAKPHSENHFIREWIGTEFNLSIPAKITHSNKPFIYFYWPNPDKYATKQRARKGGVGGVNDTRISIKKKVMASVDAVILMLGKGWNPFTNAYVSNLQHLSMRHAHLFFLSQKIQGDSREPGQGIS